ncbi:MAG TPA: hypothetical protein VGX03_26930 [Candidatus Binatia bacterium]|nr:hypothetical protein [Candidatus Binatia bacterium]
MTFDELLAQVVELLQRQGRVSYGALKRRFALDDDYVQDLKDELIDAQRAVRAGLAIITALQHLLPAGHEGPSPLVWERDKLRAARQQAAVAPLPHGRGCGSGGTR